MAWTRTTPTYIAGCWRDPEGRERSKSFKLDASTDLAKLKAQALKYALRKESEVERNEYVDPRAGKMTLQALYELVHEQTDYAPATVEVHDVVWSKFPDTLKRRTIRKITADAVTAELVKITKPGMREKTRLLLSTLFNHAINMDPPQLTTNPARLRKSHSTRASRMERGQVDSKAKVYLTDEELARLIEAMPERHRTIVHVMARVGLRPGEALALRVGKFDALNRKLQIDTAVSGLTKTGEHRTLTLPAPLADEIVAHLEQWSDPRDPDALMFPATGGGMFTVNGFRHTFQRAARAAGFTSTVTPNDLRHTAVSWAVHLGADVYYVQKMVGHSKPSITLNVYGELWDDGHQKLADLMSAAILSGAKHRDGDVLPLAR